jgi:hypothetical protein
MTGFGWNFYGFLLGVPLALLLYFVWSFAETARDRRTRRDG